MNETKIPQLETICGDCVEVLNGYDGPKFEAVIADPPYFNVKGEFDKVWPTRDSFLEDADRWAEAIERVLAPNGTLVWFCSDTMAAHIQVLLEKRFRLLNSCTVRKTNSIHLNLASIKSISSFLKNEERILIFEQGASFAEEFGAKIKTVKDVARYIEGMRRTHIMMPIIDYLNEERERAGWSVAQIRKAFGMSIPDHWFTRGSQFLLPTRDQYERLRELLNSRTSIPVLRREYDDLRRCFVLADRQTDIFDVKVNSGDSKRYGHPTVKNLNLICRIMAVICRPGTKVLDPFMGSGTTGVAARSFGLDFVGIEKDPDYCSRARVRIEATEVGTRRTNWELFPENR